MSGFETYKGLRVHISSNATNTVPRFPDKKNTKRRRRRVIGKYGSWLVVRPGAYVLMGRLVVHPAVYEEMKRSHHGAAHSPAF
jgi:hypothetical protein